MSITLVTQETMYHDLAARALNNTLKCHDFDEVLTFSNKEILPGARNVHVDHFPSLHDYCQFMLKGMLEHVKTDHIIFAQWDAMAYNPALWTDEFLKYDYIGAPWLWVPYGTNVGNGGFSLRSYKLLEALQDPRIQMDPENPDAKNEDQVISTAHRMYLQDKYKIKYPEPHLARMFSYETGPFLPSFGFHGPWNVVTLSDRDTAEYFIYNMDYTNWNEHKWSHLLEALHLLGVQEYIDYVQEQHSKYAIQDMVQL